MGSVHRKKRVLSAHSLCLRLCLGYGKQNYTKPSRLRFRHRIVDQSNGINSGANPGFKQGGYKVIYEAPKARNEAWNASGCVCGEFPPSYPFDVFFRQNKWNCVIWDTNNMVLIELGPNVIKRKFRHATSYVYNTDFWEEYGLGPCPVLMRICWKYKNRDKVDEVQLLLSLKFRQKAVDFVSFTPVGRPILNEYTTID